eukprot:14508004-Alexandrium_andersonii.AAC.1
MSWEGALAPSSPPVSAPWLSLLLLAAASSLPFLLPGLAGSSVLLALALGLHAGASVRACTPP